MDIYDARVRGIHNSCPRQSKLASPVVLNGIAWEPTVDFIASLIAGGFIESSISLYWFDEAITLASHKPSGLEEMPSISYHIHWTELSGTRDVDCNKVTDMSAQW